MIEILKNFGLTGGEVQLYLQLLKSGELKASELAKLTNTNRTFTYDRIKKLSDSGLVSHTVKDNKNYFQAASPEQLLHILKSREEQIKSILPQLEELKEPKKQGPHIEIYSSKKGIRTVLNLLLRNKSEILMQGSIDAFQNVMKEYYVIWSKRRQKAKIKLKVLSNSLVDESFTESQILDPQSNSTTFIKDNISIVVHWADQPIALLIDDKEITMNNRAIFQSLWEQPIKIYEGVQGIQDAWMELVSKPSKELVGFGFGWDLAQIYGKDFSNDWHEVRQSKKIPCRLISYDDKNSKKYFNVRMDQFKQFKLQFLSKDICGPACITLSDHLMVEFIYTEKEFKVIVSKNKEMIKAYKKYFEVLWKKSI